MGRYGCGAINNIGERLVEIFLNNGCVIGGTILPHTDIYKLSWGSAADGNTVNHIGNVVKVHRGTDVGSDRTTWPRSG